MDKTDKPSEIDLGAIFRTILSNWMIVIGATALSALLAFLITTSMVSPKYTAYATVELKAVSSVIRASSPEFTPGNSAAIEMKAESARLVSTETLLTLIKTLELNKDPEFSSIINRPLEDIETAQLIEDLRDIISIQIEKNSTLLNVVVTTYSSEKSSLIADTLLRLYVQSRLETNVPVDINDPNWIANVLTGFTNDLENLSLTNLSQDNIKEQLDIIKKISQDATLLFQFNLSKLDENFSRPFFLGIDGLQIHSIESARFTAKKSSPNLILSIVLGAWGGLVGAVIYVLNFHTHQRILRGYRSIAQHYDMPIFADVSKNQHKNKDIGRDIRSQIRDLRSAILSQRNSQANVILLSDISSKQGAGPIAESLGNSFADIDQNVLVVDFTNSTNDEVSDVWEKLKAYTSKSTGARGLTLLKGNAAFETLEPSGMVKTLQNLQAVFEQVILVAPPLAQNSDALMLYDHANLLLLCAPSVGIEENSLHDAIDRIRLVEPKETGYVLF